MRSVKNKIPVYLTFTITCLSVLVAPVVLEFIINYFDINNSGYINEIHLKHYAKILLSIVFVVSIINLPLLFINNWKKITYIIILIIVLFLPAIIEYTHVLIFGSGTNSSSWYSIFSTHKTEAIEFITDYSTSRLIAGIVVLLIVPIGIYLIFKFLFRSRLKKIFVFLSLLCLAFATIFVIIKSEFVYFKEISTYKLIGSYSDYKSEIKEFNLAISENQNMQVSLAKRDNRETHIIIIGESTAKHHMQLYGYDRQTTPELELLRDDLLIFNNVKVSYAHTIKSLEEALIIGEGSSLIDLFNSSGMCTYWLSNQKFLGKNETIISSIASRAQKKVFVSPIGETAFDQKLIHELNKVLNDDKQKRVIFIHLMGTHLSYQDRYPPSFSRFNSENISIYGDHADSFINHYDNAILYNDFIVSEIIKLCAELDHISSAIYFSDHGDEVYDFRDFHGHSQALLSKYMTDIPFLVFLNQPFKDVLLKQQINLTANLDKEVTIKYLNHTVQELLGSRSIFFDETKSYFYVDSLINYENISCNDSISMDKQKSFHEFGSKIWVHRVNSLERFNLLKDKFIGVELDIVYENEKFSVRHPPVKSSYLTLENYFESIKDIKSRYFWLDLKNLKAENMEMVISRLNYLTDKFNINDSFIIETQNVQLIPELQEAGYNVSFYFPDLASMRMNEINAEIKILKEQISLYNISTISQSIDNYMIIKEYFPQANKLIWSLGKDWSDSDSHQRIKDLLENDPTIKICLVNYDTRGWR